MSCLIYGRRRMRKFRATFALLLIGVSLQVLRAQSPVMNMSSTGTNAGVPLVPNSKVLIPREKALPINIPFIANHPLIDGRVDDELWKTSAVFRDFYQTSPGENISPSKPTEFYMAYDEKSLYVAIKCWDDKDQIRATVAQRDRVFDEDNVRFFLDTYNDQRRAYVIGFNAFGIQQDGIFTEGKGPDYSVDIVMESKGVIEDWGWSVEAEIPFKSLRYAEGKGNKWGFNVARNIKRLNDEYDHWLPDDRSLSGYLTLFGKISGLDNIKYERTLEFVPSITLSETGRHVAAVEIPAGRLVNQPVKQDIGANLKYTISQSVTFDLAINPDFAEIEADVPVISANQRFPIFFPEKRPFFLEGVDIFQSPLPIFHSRTIVDPGFAAKLTGKVGKNTFGFLVASDKSPGNFDEDERNDPSIRPLIDEFGDKSALFGVVRVKRDIENENSIGFFGTLRSFPEAHNLVGGIDGRFRLTKTLVSQFQVVGTYARNCFFDPAFDQTQDPVQAEHNRTICNGAVNNQYRAGSGLGYYVSFDDTKEKSGWYLELSGASQDYRADAGFVVRTNTNSAFFNSRVSTKADPKARLIRFNWNRNALVNYDWSGRLQGLNVGTNVSFSLQRNIFFLLSTGFGREKIYEEEFGLERLSTRSGAFVGGPTRAAWQQNFGGQISHTVNNKFNYVAFVNVFNNAFDFDLGSSPQNPGPGKQFDLTGNFEYKPTDPFRVALSFSKRRLTRRDISRRVFDANVLTLRSTYHFSRFTFARLRADYNTLSHNLNGQVLFGWTPNPGTAWYVGYTDNLRHNGFNPYTGTQESGLERNNRTFFMRMSYLFRRSF